VVRGKAAVTPKYLPPRQRRGWSAELCEKPQQHEGSWCRDEPSFRYLDRSRGRRAVRTGSV